MPELTCSVCQTPLAPRHPRVRDPQSAQCFAILACPDCGLGATTPQPADLGAYYGPRYYGNRHGFTARLCMRRRADLLERLAPTPGAVLDIGCGDGSFLREAQARGWAVTGTELGSEPLLPGGIPVFAEISEAARDRRFDVVTMWHSLEHFRDVDRAIAQARAAVRPGGALLVAVPDAGGLQARCFGRKWFHLDVPRHLFHFTKDSLTRLLTKHELVIESWRHQESELDVFGWMQSALNWVLAEPNVLFNSLTGKPTHAGPVARALSYTLGSCVFPASVGATALSALVGRGGTLIASARAAR